MKRLITEDSPIELKALFINDIIFNMIVMKSENEGIDYIDMLEKAVVEIAKQNNYKEKLLMKYQYKYGPLDDF